MKYQVAFSVALWGLSTGIGVGHVTAQDELPESLLATDETIDRFDELPRRRPFHECAFEAIVSQYTSEGRLADLVEHDDGMFVSLDSV